MTAAILYIVLLFYDLLYVLLSPLIFLYLLSRRDSRKRLAQYLGLPKKEIIKLLVDGRGCLLVHAVSVGEVLSAVPIARRLKKELKLPLILSTTIDDAETISQKAPGLFDGTTFINLDFSIFVKKFLSTLNPQLIIVSETDLWPNFLWECKKRRINLYLTNGRLSEKIITGASMFRPLASELLMAFKCFFVQRPIDKSRLLSLGLPPGTIKVQGNTKYEGASDIPKASSTAAKIISLLKKSKHSVLVAGSTHAGEEELLLALLGKLGPNFPNLVIAPRIITRAPEISLLFKKSGYKVSIWSEICEKGNFKEIKDSDIFIIDVLGELKHIYDAGDLVFMGGTFVEVGGHNFLEACALGKAVIMGPDVHNFSLDAELFLENRAIVQVADDTEFFATVKRLLQKPEELSSIGTRALQVIKDNKGAADRTASAIIEDMKAMSAVEVGTEHVSD